MAGQEITAEMAAAVVELIRVHGSAMEAARVMQKSKSWIDRRYRKARALGLCEDLHGDRNHGHPAQPVIKGRVGIIQRQQLPLPAPGQIRRHIFTCAQSNTLIHEPLWENMRALAKHYDADIHVSTFTYDVTSYGAASVKRGQDKSKQSNEPWYDIKVTPYISDDSILVAPGLVWCGEMNILPTAVRPLSGLESYTGRKSGIFPHVKIAMESIASGKFEGTKLNYTTGTVTTRNYIQKKAGQKAEFHHGYGGLLVEVDSEGGWWCRQLNGDSEGTLYDFDVRAMDGVVTTGHRVKGIQWGDIHRRLLSVEMRDLLWGITGSGISMIDSLRPEHQFMEDVIDFRPRNHHDMKNFHRMYKKWVQGDDDVFAELLQCAHFLKTESFRPWCKTVVVRSNHDAAFDRWLREADYKEDFKNARFFLKSQLAFLDAIHAGDDGFLPLEWVCHELGVPEDVKFLRQDESFIICPDANGGIECGHHGDKGANGAKGSLAGFAKTGRKVNIGDKHSAGIQDGAYLAGVAGDMDHGYNEGMSSWSNSHIVTYPNGKRCIVTVWNGKWRA